jgi:hypothetical protein
VTGKRFARVVRVGWRRGKTYYVAGLRIPGLAECGAFYPITLTAANIHHVPCK